MSEEPKQERGDKKYPILIGEILTKPTLGIYTQTIWYNDGSIETIEIPKGPVIIPIDLCWLI